MNSKIAIPIIIESIIEIIIVIAGIIAIAGIIVIANQETTKEQIKVQWRESGSFTIEKYEYYLDEKNFLTVQNIPNDTSGEVVFFRPVIIPNVLGSDGISRDMDRGKVHWNRIWWSKETKC